MAEKPASDTSRDCGINSPSKLGSAHGPETFTVVFFPAGIKSSRWLPFKSRLIETFDGVQDVYDYTHNSILWEECVSQLKLEVSSLNKSITIPIND